MYFSAASSVLNIRVFFYDSNDFIIVFITFIIPFIWQITSL